MVAGWDTIGVRRRRWHRAPGTHRQELLDVLQGHTDQVNSVAWSPDGTRLALHTDALCTVECARWHHSPADIRVGDRSKGHAQLSAAWSPDGTRLASVLRLHGTGVGYDDGSGTGCPDGHTSAVESVAWPPDGMRLASASSDRTVRVWMLRREQRWQLSMGTRRRCKVWLGRQKGRGWHRRVTMARYGCGIWRRERHWLSWKDTQVG